MCYRQQETNHTCYVVFITAVFDIVVKTILLHTLQHEHGITDSVTAWIKLSLSHHYQAVYINVACSVFRILTTVGGSNIGYILKIQITQCPTFILKRTYI